MGENEIYEALGVKPPEAGEEPDQAAGEPSGGQLEDETTPETELGEEQEEETAEPSRGAATGGLSAKSSAKRSFTEPEGETENGPAQEEAGKAQQEAIQRAVAEAVARERERVGEEWKQFFARAGLKNTATGAAISSKEEFEDWYRSYEAARLEKELKDGKLTPESLRSLTDRAVAEQLKQRQPELPQGTEVTREQIDRELAEIHRMDGSVNGLEDILKMETGPAFRDAVRRGHSFLDAFKLANFDRLQQRRQAEAANRAAQAARNNVASKEHLKASTSKGSGSTPVPGDVMEMYRMMMPGATEAEITAHYNRMLKEMKT